MANSYSTFKTPLTHHLLCTFLTHLGCSHPTVISYMKLHSHPCCCLTELLGEVVLAFSFLHPVTLSREFSSCTGLLIGLQTARACSTSGPLPCTSLLLGKLFRPLCMGPSLSSSVLRRPLLREAFPGHPLRILPSVPLHLTLSLPACFPDVTSLTACISPWGYGAFVYLSSLASFCVFPPDKSAPGGQ